MSRGRSCPLDYRYRASDIAHAPLPEGLRGLETLYVVGGLYGNPEALAAVLAAFEAEPGGRRKALVFNGDFHWFDAEPDGFATVQAAVMRHWATRGNVETELAREQIGAAGCGCAYPDFVDSATVAHSNRIIERLHAAVPAGQRAVLAALPPFLRAEVAGMAVGIVHGDAESLAGWGFSQEAFKAPEAVAAAGRACEDARVAVFASSHSCLPVLQGLGGGRWLAISPGMMISAQMILLPGWLLHPGQVAEQVARRRHQAHHPQQRAPHVVERELAARHLGHAGHEGREGAHEGHEARQTMVMPPYFS
jgi:hypothetical protein